MFQSLKIGRAFGIPLYVHWTFWLLPLWVVMISSGEPALGVALNLGVLAAAFGCVVLHELGHALAARAFGIGTRDISLYPIGGVARLEHMSEKPSEELWIAVAGPAVNLVIAAALTAVLLVLAVVGPAMVVESVGGMFLFNLLRINVLLVLFNLLPAFPMDGGRVLRALLAMKLGHLRATRIAVGIGMVIALAGGLAGTLLLGNPWMMVIAFFVFMAGQAELQAIYFREQQKRMQALTGFPPEGWAPAPYSAPRAEPQTQEPSPFLRPRITVYTWDAETGRWVRDAGPSPGSAL